MSQITPQAVSPLPMDVWDPILSLVDIEHRPINEVIDELTTLARLNRNCHDMVTSQRVTEIMLNRLGITPNDGNRTLNWLEHLSQRTTRYRGAGQQEPAFWGVARQKPYPVPGDIRTAEHCLALTPTKVVSWSGATIGWSDGGNGYPVAVFQRGTSSQIPAGISIKNDRHRSDFRVGQFEGNFYGCLSATSSRVAKLEHTRVNGSNTLAFSSPVCQIGCQASFSGIDPSGRIVAFTDTGWLQIWNVRSRELMGSCNTGLRGLLTQWGINHRPPRILMIKDKVYLVWQTNTGRAFYQFDISDARSIRAGNNPMAGGGERVAPPLKVHTASNGQDYVVWPRKPDNSNQLVDLYYGSDLQHHKALQLAPRPSEPRRTFSNTRLQSDRLPCYAISGDCICVPYSQTCYASNHTGPISTQHRYAIWDITSDSNQPIIEGNLDPRFEYYRVAMDGHIAAFLRARRIPGQPSVENPDPPDRLEHEVQVVNTFTNQTLWTRPFPNTTRNLYDKPTEPTDIKIEQGTVYVALNDSRVEVFSPPEEAGVPNPNPNPGTPVVSTPEDHTECSTALIIPGIVILMVAGYYAYLYGSRQIFANSV